MNTQWKEEIIESIVKNEFDNAISIMNDNFKEHYDEPEIHLYLGIIHELKHENAIAMRHYRSALALDGTSEVILYNLYRLGDNSTTKTPIRYY